VYKAATATAAAPALTKKTKSQRKAQTASAKCKCKPQSAGAGRCRPTGASLSQLAASRSASATPSLSAANSIPFLVVHPLQSAPHSTYTTSTTCTSLILAIHGPRIGFPSHPYLALRALPTGTCPHPKNTRSHSPRMI
jgi:hypothetical protein